MLHSSSFVLRHLLPWAAMANFIKLPGFSQAEPSRIMKIGIIGLDTSHVVAFTKSLKDRRNQHHVPSFRVVAAHKGGSPDVEESWSRVDKFKAELHDKWNVEIVNDIPNLCARVDAVLLESVDGRPHLQQVKPVIAAHKLVFIDKPLAGSYKDAQEIFELGRRRASLGLPPPACASGARRNA